MLGPAQRLSFIDESCSPGRLNEALRTKNDRRIDHFGSQAHDSEAFRPGIFKGGDDLERPLDFRL